MATFESDNVPEARAEETESLPGRTSDSGLRIGPYRTLGLLGEGGFGVVYLAEQTEPIRRRVALKVIKPGMDSRAVIARFEAERQALALMDHPNVARVFDAGMTEGGRSYFAMEHVPGVPITEHCDRQKLGIGERLKLFIQVCEAVQHAHQKGVIHRDLKPTNILVTTKNGEAVPKVIDFGVAKAISQPLTEKTIFTEQGQLIGTPAYMSPEQAEMTAQDIDTRSDIYSLGVLLYELLTGALPFDPTTLRQAAFDEIRRMIREVEPQRPSTKLGSAITAGGDDTTAAVRNRRTDARTLTRVLRGDLDWITMKALEKDRTRRYASASDFAADIRRHLSHEPVVAGPPSAAYRVGKFVRRNRGLVAATAAVLAVLLAGVAGTTWQAVIATRQRDQARVARQEATAAQAAEAEQRHAAELQTYIANLAAADAALRLNDAGEMHRRLDAAPERYRNWEWRHLRARSDLSLATLRGHTGEVRSAGFSPDGTRIVTRSLDKTAKVWDAATGSELATLGGHTDEVRSASFSPDGTRIVTGSDDGTAKVWDAATGSELATLRGHPRWVRSASFSPDGTRIVTGSPDKTAKVWDAATGSELATLRGHTRWVWSATFSPDGTQIVTASPDKTAKVWDAATGSELATLRGHSGEVSSASFSPDGTRIVTGSWDKTAKVWDAATGRELATLRGYAPSFSPDGTRIVTGSRDDTAKVWDAATGSELATLRGHTGRVRSASFSPDGTRIVTGSCDKTAKVWDAATGSELATLRGHTADVRSASFSPDGTRIVTGSRDSTAKVWDAEGDQGGSPKAASELATLRGHTSDVRSASFSPDGTRIVTGSLDKTAKVWDAATGSELATLRGHADSVSSASFSPDGTRIVTASHDNTGKVWDAATASELSTLRGHASLVLSASFSPDGTRIVTASGDDTAKVWDAGTASELSTLRGHADMVRSASFNPDGTRIVTASGDDTAKVWDAATGSELSTLRGHASSVLSTSFSPDGTRIITGSTDKTAKVWDVPTASELATLRGHADSVLSASFSPDGTRIVTASGDHTAKVWDAATGSELATLRGYTDGVSSASFSPDGTRIVTGSWDGTAIWDTDSYTARFEERRALLGARSGMQPLVDRLWRSLHDPKAVARSVREDPALSPTQRRVALDLLLIESSRSADVVRDLLDSLFAEHVLADEVVAALESDHSLSTCDRAVAIASARSRGDSPKRLNEAAWDRVRFPGADPSTYMVGVRAAEAAARAEPDNGFILNTLGVAQYRVGRYADALETLTRSDGLNAERLGGSIPGDVAFIAMSLLHLGRTAEAQAELTRLRELMQNAWWANDPESQSFLREAEALISGTSDTKSTTQPSQE